MQTLEEIGQALQISRERVRQIEARALEKLRHVSASASCTAFWRTNRPLRVLAQVVRREMGEAPHVTVIATIWPGSSSRAIASSELGQVIGADRDAVEELGKRLGEDDVGWNLAYAIHLQAVLATLQASLGEHRQHLLALRYGATNRDYQLDVRQL